jgi:hypothetical protein
MLRVLIEVPVVFVLHLFTSVRTSKAVENNLTTALHQVQLLQMVCTTNLNWAHAMLVPEVKGCTRWSLQQLALMEARRLWSNLLEEPPRIQTKSSIPLDRIRATISYQQLTALLNMQPLCNKVQNGSINSIASGQWQDKKGAAGPSSIITAPGITNTYAPGGNLTLREQLHTVKNNMNHNK